MGNDGVRGRAERARARRASPPARAPDSDREATPRPAAIDPRAATEIANVVALQGLAGNEATTRLLATTTTAAAPTGVAGRRPSQSVQRIGDFDPMATTDANAKGLLRELGSDWAKAKDALLVQPQTATDRAAGERKMNMLVHYRKRYVDRKLLELKSRFPELRTKSVGSLNLTSDYDITLSGKGDVDAMNEFNESFRAEWGKESGTLFDTNLYAKDFLPVRSNVAYPFGSKQIAGWKGVKPRKWTSDDKGGWKSSESRRIETEGADSGLQQPTHAASKKQASADQDVYALVKQRKYMTQSEWSDYVTGLLAGLPAATRADARARYDRADELFGIYVRDVLVQLESEGKKLDRALPPEEQLAEIEHEEADAATRARNKIYAQKVKAARRLQERFEKLKTEPGDHAAELDELAVQIKETVAHATVFAIEAYHTEGAVLDVVGVQQGGQQMQLGVDQYLQSYNEQLGDFLKDLSHYESAGEAFYRSAKYLRRLVLAARQIVQMTGGRVGSEVVALLGSLETMGDPGKPLLKIRSLHEDYRTKTDDDKRVIAEDFVKQLLGIATKDDLRQRVLALSRTINGLVRQLGGPTSSTVVKSPTWRKLLESTKG